MNASFSAIVFCLLINAQLFSQHKNEIGGNEKLKRDAFFAKESSVLNAGKSVEEICKEQNGPEFILNLSKRFLLEGAVYERNKVDPDNNLRRGNSYWKISEELLSGLYELSLIDKNMKYTLKEEISFSYVFVILGRHPSNKKLNVEGWKALKEAVERFPDSERLVALDCYRISIFEDPLKGLEKFMELPESETDLYKIIRADVLGLAGMYDESFELLLNCLEKDSLAVAPGLMFQPFVSLEEINSIFSGIEYSARMHFKNRE